MALAESGAGEAVAPSPASRAGHLVSQSLPVVDAVGLPIDALGAAAPVGSTKGVELIVPGTVFRAIFPGSGRHSAHSRAEQVAGVGGGVVAGLFNGNVGLTADVNPLDPLNPPLFLSRKLKDAVDADPGNAGFPLSQPALLGGDKAAENAAFPGIDGIVPFIAVFAGGPGFGFGKGIGLVNAAVKGFAPVFGQGFQDGRSPVGVGKGLPVGTVPGDGPGLG